MFLLYAFTSSATFCVSRKRLLQVLSPNFPLTCDCTFFQAGNARRSFSSPPLDSRNCRSRRSLPRRSAIQSFRLMIASVRVRLVLSIASIFPSRSCETSPASSKACNIVNCVARNPSGRSASSYNCVSARAVRRKLAHMHGNSGIVDRFMLDRCIYIYFGCEIIRPLVCKPVSRSAPATASAQLFVVSPLESRLGTLRLRFSTLFHSRISLINARLSAFLLWTSLSLVRIRPRHSNTHAILLMTSRQPTPFCATVPYVCHQPQPLSPTPSLLQHRLPESCDRPTDQPKVPVLPERLRACRWGSALPRFSLRIAALQLGHVFPSFSTATPLRSRRKSRNSIRFMPLLHDLRTPRGWGSSLAARHPSLAPIPFRINTYGINTKHSTLSTFGINTYEKTWGASSLALRACAHLSRRFP